MNQKLNSRIIHIDVLRGIAILCIIIGHLGVANINRVVFTFHVTVFYLISGYFVSDGPINKKFIEKKARSLLTPYVFTCMVITVIGVIKGFCDGGFSGAGNALSDWLFASLYGAGDSYAEPFYIKGIGAIWFLLASFWGIIFLKIAINLKKCIQGLFIIALFLIGYYSREVCWFPFSIQAGCCATLFMYVGYCYSQIKNIIGVNKLSKGIITCVATIVWIQFIYNFESFWLVHCDVGRGIIDIIGSFCACYVVLNISKLLVRITSKRCVFLHRGLAFVGKNSLVVLCVHIVELTFVPWGQVESFLINKVGSTTVSILLVILAKYIGIIIAVCLIVKNKDSFILNKSSRL